MFVSTLNAKLKHNNSTFPRIKGESIKIMRVLFFYFSTPNPLDRYRYVLQEFSFASLQLHVVKSS